MQKSGFISTVRIILFSIALFSLPVGPVCILSMAAARPNIIIILADDLGYADVGVYGCKDVPTPQLDTIAKNGVRFTNAYANHPVCSPSRAGLLSGMYQHRFGFENNSGPERYAAANFGIPRNVPILAEKLKQAGYATGMVGKWHVGFNEGLRPHERGFDFFYGFLSGAHSYVAGDHNPMYRNGEQVEDETEYMTDALARETENFIAQHKDEPFFFYMSFNAVHLPLEATEAYEERFPNITDKKRKTYAGMLSAMDDAVGRVLTKLREYKLEENTLVLFYSDNGGPTSQTTSRNDPLRGFKGQMFEGGIRIPYIFQWKGKLPAGATYNNPVMGFDVHATALAAAGVDVPANKPIDGKNLIPYIIGQKTGKPHAQLFWRSSAQHAARVGDWKLVVASRTPPMLFNLAEDIGEQKDLAQKRPDKLKEVQAIYADWSSQMMEPQWIRQDGNNAELGGKLKAGTSTQSRLETYFRSADSNGDGRVSAEEFKRPNVFKAVDKNKDGFATLKEMRDYYANRQK